MKKVIIIGCSGAVKITFARKLHNAMGLPLYSERATPRNLSVVKSI